MREDRAITIIARLLGQIDGLDDPIDQRSDEWAYVVETACETGLGGLILEAFSARGVQAPAFVDRALRSAAVSVARRNGRMMAKLEPMVAAFNDAAIPVMLLKGAALNSSVYESPCLRPMSDVDLLVPERDATRAVDVLKHAGCHEGQQLIRSDFFPRFYYETELVTEEPEPLRLDLHARPLRPLRYAGLIEESEFWRNARDVRVGQARALIPSPETMLIQLAAHAAFHGCSRFIWLYDLKRWAEVHENSIDWERFDRLCAGWKLSAAVRQGLDRTEGLFGSIVPDATRARLLAQRVDWRDRLTLRQAPRDAGSPWLHVLTNVLCLSGLRNRVGYLAAQLTPHREHLADVYPFRHRGWAFVAGGYRLVRAAGRLIGSGARRLPLIGTSLSEKGSSHGVTESRENVMSGVASRTVDLKTMPTSACPGM